MSSSFWNVVNEVIKKADILLEVLDGRMIEQTRNIEIEDKIKSSGKPLIYVINKCDLVEKEEMEKIKRKLRPSVFVSATQRLGSTMLLHEILKQSNMVDVAKRSKKKTYGAGKKQSVYVGVLGYPNTGKSSVINVLAGRSKAKTSPISGFTKGKQFIKLKQGVYLIDTPGVLPYKESDETKQSIIAAKDQTKLKEPDLAVLQIIKSFPGVIESHYGVKTRKNPEKILESIAIKFNRLKRGGEPDIQVMARKILQDWQAGKIGKKENAAGKNIFPKQKQEEILERIKDSVRKDFQENKKVNAVVAIGSILDWKLGKYSQPKKGRAHSDIDLVVFVEDDFEIPGEWKLHLKSDYYAVYNTKEIDSVLVQYWIAKKSDYSDPEKQQIAEKRGVPFMQENSKNRFLWILKKH